MGIPTKSGSLGIRLKLIPMDSFVPEQHWRSSQTDSNAQFEPKPQVPQKDAEVSNLFSAAERTYVLFRSFGGIAGLFGLYKLYCCLRRCGKKRMKIDFSWVAEGDKVRFSWPDFAESGAFTYAVLKMISTNDRLCADEEQSGKISMKNIRCVEIELENGTPLILDSANEYAWLSVPAIADGICTDHVSEPERIEKYIQKLQSEEARRRRPRGQRSPRDRLIHP